MPGNGVAAKIRGSQSVIEWFGRWPSFHDAELMTFHIDRERGTSFMRVRAFNITDRIDNRGQFIKTQEAVVVFEFSGIRTIHLDGEDADVQNVMSSLLIEEVAGGYRVIIGPSYGIGGEFVVTDIRVRLE
jgi:hypothetical protein